MLITQHQLNEHMHTNRTTVNNFFPDKPKFIHNTIKFTRFYYNFVIILVKSAAFWECSQISFAVLFKVNSNFICNKKKRDKKKQRTRANECEEEGNLWPLDFSLCVYVSVPLCMAEFIRNKAVSMFRFLYYNRYLNGNCQTSKQTSGKTSNSANHICNWGRESSTTEREGERADLKWIKILKGMFNTILLVSS